jgi:hypothetical protein
MRIRSLLYWEAIGIRGAVLEKTRLCAPQWALNGANIALRVVVDAESHPFVAVMLHVGGRLNVFEAR